MCDFKHKNNNVILGRLLQAPSRPNNIRGGLKCPSVGTSVRPQNFFFDFTEIWYVYRGRWLMHDGMPYDPIQGQGHGASEVPKIPLFKVFHFHHLQWELANDHRFL